MKDSAGIYRAFYATKIGPAVFVFHAFMKKNQKTPLREIAIGKKRLKEMMSLEKKKMS